MEGSLRTVRILSDPSRKTNFNDWSDPKLKLPIRKAKHIENVEECEEEVEEEPKSSSASVVSHTDEEIENLRRKIKAGHPLLTKKEIRNYRLPFHESLLLNLKEDGFILTYEFIKELIEVDDIFHKELETNANLKNRPYMKYEQSLLTTLANDLVKAEVARLEKKQMEEAQAFLGLALHLTNFGNRSWQWIAEEMFEQCIGVIDQENSDVTPKMAATAKYLYAVFLFREIFDLNAAKKYVEASMALSEGKNWHFSTGSEEQIDKSNNLYFDSCLLLHEIFLQMAHQEYLSPEDAIQLCRNSLLWAKMINNKPAESKALLKLIQIYLSVKQLSPVSELLESYMKLCTEENYIQGLCDGYILYARYYDILGEPSQAVGAIKNLLKVAKENEENNMAAMAHHKLAVYYLQKGHEKELQDHAINAYKFYKDSRSGSNMEESRCLVGIAQAQEIMTQYCELVVQADQPAELDVLLRWKNLRIPFFSKVQLLQPEADFNLQLYEKVQSMRAEDVAETKYKHEDIGSVPSGTKSRSIPSFLMRSESRSTGNLSFGLFSGPKKSTLTEHLSIKSDHLSRPNEN